MLLLQCQAQTRLFSLQPPSGPAPEFMKRSQARLGVATQYDVVLCGGTLGIFLATALQLAGHRCACTHRY